VTLDKMLYLVISDHPSAAPIIWEREPRQMDRATVIADLCSGQYGPVLHIIELNPVEGICREVTDDPEFREALARDADHV
jgi:hypothetical protein